MPNFGYHFARWTGNLVRKIYRALLPIIARRPVPSNRAIAVDVFYYSGEAALPEQVASIRSFLRHVGRPKNFTVVSDGSYTDKSIRLLEQVDSSVTVCREIHVPAELPGILRQYLAAHPTGKQLALIMTLPRNHAALYIDSDVRFFPGAVDLLDRATEQKVSAYYLPDCQFSGDRRLLHDRMEEQNPVNTGVLLLFEKLDWSLSIDRFLELKGEPNFFTNQTMAHLTMHQNGARPFDPAKYILQLDDQFVFSDRYAGAPLTLRHYVNPVRHKFWMNFGTMELKNN